MTATPAVIDLRRLEKVVALASKALQRFGFYHLSSAAPPEPLVLRPKCQLAAMCCLPTSA
jgi:hypothetical protein